METDTMSKLEKVFDTPNKKAFIGFLTAGDPDADSTVKFILEMEKAGADLIEIGIPFSDPTAEGVVIQEANIRSCFIQSSASILLSTPLPDTAVFSAVTSMPHGGKAASMSSNVTVFRSKIRQMLSSSAAAAFQRI